MKKLIAVVAVLAVLFACGVAFADNDIKIFVNGSQIYSDVSPQIINGRTMIPVRAVAEALGCQVSWNGQNNEVDIASGDQPNTDPPVVNGPANFKEIIQGALNLLKEKNPAKYTWVITGIKQIIYENPVPPEYSDASAFIDKENKIVFINGKDFDEIVKTCNKNDVMLLYIGTLTHESNHYHLNLVKLNEIYNHNDVEGLCNLAALRTIQEIGGNDSSFAVQTYKKWVSEELAP